jgi:hypothetical protein
MVWEDTGQLVTILLFDSYKFYTSLFGYPASPTMTEGAEEERSAFVDPVGADLDDIFKRGASSSGSPSGG